MLRSAKELRGYAITASDGDIGQVDDLYFDDEAWVMRYLAVDTGTWLPGRRVLISPISLDHPDWMAQRLPVALTAEQVRTAPISTRRNRSHGSTKPITSATTDIPTIGAAWACGEWVRTRAT